MIFIGALGIGRNGLSGLGCRYRGFGIGTPFGERPRNSWLLGMQSIYQRCKCAECRNTSSRTQPSYGQTARIGFSSQVTLSSTSYRFPKAESWSPAATRRLRSEVVDSASFPASPRLAPSWSHHFMLHEPSGSCKSTNVICISQAPCSILGNCHNRHESDSSRKLRDSEHITLAPSKQLLTTFRTSPTSNQKRYRVHRQNLKMTSRSQLPTQR